MFELSSFFKEQTTNLNHIIKYVKIKPFFNIVMPSEDTKILQFNKDQKSDKAPITIYVDFELLIEKINGCKDNPKNSSAIKAVEHIASGFSKHQK